MATIELTDRTIDAAIGADGITLDAAAKPLDMDQVRAAADEG